MDGFMAMARPASSDTSIEDLSENANSSYLEDAEDDAEETSLGPLADYVTTQYQRAKDARRPKEQRWLKHYRNYRGFYGDDTKFTKEEKSKVFLKITKTKVLAAYAQNIEVLFAGSRFPIGYEPRNFPAPVADAVTLDPGQVTQEKLEEQAPEIDYEVPRRYLRPEIETELGMLKDKLEPIQDDLTLGTAGGPQSVVFEPAKEAARLMSRKVHDQLAESEADKHLRMFVFEQCLFGTGGMKGPFAYDKEYPKWTEEGTYDPLTETIPKIEARSIWNLYPDPEARTPDEMTFMVDRHRLSKTQLRRLKKRPMFRASAIDEAISHGPNYVPEYWENQIDEVEGLSTNTRFEALEFWGVVDTEVLQDAEVELPDGLEDLDEVEVNIWICNGQILRVVANPFTPKRIPYFLAPHEVDPYSIWGVGVAENMDDTQLLMNGFMRLAIDNAALSGNLLIEIDETHLVPGQDMSIYPGKIFRRQAGAPGQAIFGTKFPNVSQEMLMMFDKARQLSDESTGIPSFSHGMSGIMGVGRTASGMSMLMGASATNTKTVVRNTDDYLLTPLAKAFFAFNMQFHFDKAFTQGDVEPKGMGVESVQRGEVRSQRLLQFMQLTANPVLQPFVRYDYLLEELAASMDLDERKVINDPAEAAIQAKMMADVAGLMPQPPAGPAPGPGGQPPGGAAGPGVQDPTGNGNGNIAPGAAPEPGGQGFTGAGGGDNGGTSATAESTTQMRGQ